MANAGIGVMFGPGGKWLADSMGKGGGSGPQIIEDTAYNQMMQNGQGGNFNDLANSNSTYLADMFSQLGTGQAPSYYQSYQNQAMPYYQNLMNQQYFGTPGNRGQNAQGGPSGIGNAMTMASMFGLNPKATTGMVNKNQLAYQNASSMLDQYFAQQQYGNIQNSAANLPGMATQQQNSFTQAFEPHFSGIIPGVAAPNYFGPAMQAAGSVLGGMVGGPPGAMAGNAAGSYFGNSMSSGNNGYSSYMSPSAQQSMGGAQGMLSL